LRTRLKKRAKSPKGATWFRTSTYESCNHTGRPTRSPHSSTEVYHEAQPPSPKNEADQLSTSPTHTPKNQITFSQWQLREGDPLYRVGVKNLSTSHLVAHIIRDKTKAEQLLETIPTIERIASASIVQLKQAGLTKAQAETLHAAVELARRWMSSSDNAPQISSPADVMRLFQHSFRGEKQERLVVLTLNTKNRMTHHETVFKGSLSGTTVHPREIFNVAIRESAASIILVHNHPSGQAEPSDEDIRATHNLVKASLLIEIPILDHIIIGEGCYTSLKEEGTLNP
jgi:DNA repair protein RadC